MRMFTSFLCLTVALSCTVGVRVCSNFGAYNWLFSGDCYDNPASDQNMTEIIQSWGFTAEEHHIITDDGYILLLERAYSSVTTQTPILIVHGIAMNGLGFIYQGNASLVYFLGSLGYDVWILNYRGTWYSKGHTHLSTKDKKYWSFSINELGVYDVRSTVRYINEKTGKKLIYIGYSMGTTGFYIYSTTFPNETEAYVKGMIGLAPVINFEKPKSIVALTASPVLWPVLKNIVYMLWNGEILPGYSVFVKPLMKFSTGIYFAQNMLNLMFGDDYEQMNALTYPLLPTWIDTVGVETYTHYVQMYQTQEFKNYDHGVEKNVEVYGQAYPPAYNLSRVPVPIALFVGPNDWLATPTNAEHLYSKLPSTSKCGCHFVELSKWNHIDFFVAKDVVKYLYNKVSNKIKNIENVFQMLKACFYPFYDLQNESGD